MAGADPSMEEILASIRRIIADDQAMIAEAATESLAQEKASAAKPAQVAADTDRSGDTVPVPVRPAAPPPVVQAARAPVTKSDEDFEAWLSETARRARANQFGIAPEASQAATPADTNARKGGTEERPAWAEGWDEPEEDRAKAGDSHQQSFDADNGDWNDEAERSEADPLTMQAQADRDDMAETASQAAAEAEAIDAADPVAPVEVGANAESAQVLDMPATGPRDTSGMTSSATGRPSAAQGAASPDGEKPLPSESVGVDDDDDLDAPVSPAGDQSGLMSSNASTSVSASFQALAQTMMLQNSDMIENAIRGMLKPMLKQWLDDNLPPLVERLVRAEIERVARGGP